MTWLRLHALALGEALRRLAANPFANAVSILVLAVALSLPVLAAMALATAGVATSSLDTQAHVNVYLALDAGDDDVKRVGQALRSQPAVASVKFISRTEALGELKATTHLAEILAALDRNPLPHAFTVRLKPGASGDVAALKDQWSRLPKVDAVAADFEWAERLSQWIRFGNRLLVLLGAFLAVAVAFIVGHLIRLQVLTRRDEIAVSRLLGATAADVRRPFAYHGLLQGVLAGAVAVGLATGLGLWLGAEMRALAPAYVGELKVVLPGPNLWAALTLGAAFLGLAGASFAVARELRSLSAGR